MGLGQTGGNWGLGELRGGVEAGEGMFLGISFWGWEISCLLMLCTCLGSSFVCWTANIDPEYIVH